MTVFVESMATVHSSGSPGDGAQFADQPSKSEFAAALALRVTTVLWG